MAGNKNTRKKNTGVKTTTEKTDKVGVEIGASGTNIFSGIINEEYNSELSGTSAMKIYDEMRRSDATVKAALLAINLPIRRAQWFIKPASEDEQDIIVKDFVSKALFDLQTITWDDFLRQALLSTTFGVMLFEKVFEIKSVDGVDRIIWRKFAPRLPKSISAWQTKDKQDGVTQIVTDGADVSIPIEKLLIFVNEKEGDNWWGISFLRPAYKHWWYKKGLENIDALAHERQGLGVPFVKLLKSHTQADITKAETILQNMRAHDQGYLIEPPNLSVEFKDMKSGTTKDANRAIAYHDRQIVKAVLAQFLDLGSGPTGSRSLSEDHSALFLQSLEAVANGVKDVINKFAIKQLVDLNFNNMEAYPEIDFTGISRTDVDKISTAMQRFQQSGLLTPQKSDEQYVREIVGLPEKVDDEDADDKEDDIDINDDDIEMSEHKKKEFTEDDLEPTKSERLFQSAIDKQEIMIQRAFDKEWVPFAEKTEQAIKDFLLSKLDEAKTETVGGVLRLAKVGNTQLQAEMERGVTKIMKRAEKTMLGDKMAGKLMKDSAKNAEDLIRKMDSERKDFVELPTLTQVSNYMKGLRSNIKGVIFNKTRQIKERIHDNFTQGASVKLMIQQIKELKINRNIYKLSAITHPRAVFKGIIDQHYKEGGTVFFKMLTPTQIRNGLTRGGRIVALMFLIKTFQDWDKEANEKDNVNVTGGLGIHHNSQEYFYPVDQEVLDDEREIARLQRTAWIIFAATLATQKEKDEE